MNAISLLAIRLLAIYFFGIGIKDGIPALSALPHTLRVGGESVVLLVLFVGLSFIVSILLWVSAPKISRKISLGIDEDSGEKQLTDYALVSAAMFCLGVYLLVYSGYFLINAMQAYLVTNQSIYDLLSIGRVFLFFVGIFLILRPLSLVKLYRKLKYFDQNT
ncbi:hypothetical protein QSV34_02875 [Porticoccus sp. W117]|uniref:hypothetical protein n=1 Tax=Porticoccus sp. W117 TaxID=3054777 RepID=UPI00259AB566|nr:hypothetical protein [Porticoccus sp. W117]MDM3870295.1 hypothetical protein [Porticoccus sp. W117]